MADYSTREADSFDVPAINQLFNEAITEGLLTWNTKRPIAFHETWFKSLTRKGLPCLLAVSHDEIVGYCALEPENPYDDECTDYHAVLSCVVRKKYRRHGIAQFLWSFVRRHEKTKRAGVCLVTCKVLTTNSSGNALLQHLIFTDDGTLDNVAEREGKYFGFTRYSRFISAAPEIKGRYYPSFDYPQVLGPTSPESISTHSATFAIRRAAMDDLPFLVDIYNDSILHSIALPWTQPRSVLDRQEWLQDHLINDYPILIAADKNEALAYISLAPWRDVEECFRHTFEVSLYVHSACKRKGIAEALWRRLLRTLGEYPHDVKIVISDISVGNAPAMAATLKAGFEQKVYMARPSAKFGQFVDAAYCQLYLQGCTASGEGPKTVE